ncbi:hypothetical protein ABK040_009436 [Willaertia magna]
MDKCRQIINKRTETDRLDEQRVDKHVTTRSCGTSFKLSHQLYTFSREERERFISLNIRFAQNKCKHKHKPLQDGYYPYDSKVCKEKVFEHSFRNFYKNYEGSYESIKDERNYMFCIHKQHISVSTYRRKMP